MPSQKFDNNLIGRHVLVTGGTGQVGRRLVMALTSHGAQVSVMSRSPQSAPSILRDLPVELRKADVTQRTTLDGALAGIDIVFHLASFSGGGAHLCKVYESPQHWDVSALGTQNIIDAVVKSGCRRFVYFSSVKAMGESAGTLGRPDNETALSVPETLYGRSKLAAEKTILEAARHTQLCATILRLPMVYGLDGAGNLGRMIDGVARRRFPPIPKVYNHRSAVHVEDAVQAALCAVKNSRACGRTFLVTDEISYSTRWIYEQICLALGHNIPIWALPKWCWRLAARLGTWAESDFGISSPLTNETLGKLFGDAWFSSKRIQKDLGFEPRFELDSEIVRMVQRYLEKQRTEPDK